MFLKDSALYKYPALCATSDTVRSKKPVENLTSFSRRNSHVTNLCMLSDSKMDIGNVCFLYIRTVYRHPQFLHRRTPMDPRCWSKIEHHFPKEFTLCISKTQPATTCCALYALVLDSRALPHSMLSSPKCSNYNVLRDYGLIPIY